MEAEAGALLLLESAHKEPRRYTIDEILQEFVGEFGAAQLLHFTFSNLALTIAAMHIFVTIFADQNPAWQCAMNDQVCRFSSSICGLDTSSWEWVNPRESSIVSEWNLVCEQGYKVGLVGSIFFLCAMFGSGICGCLSDSFMGRKGVLALTSVIIAASGMLTALSPNYWTYVMFRGFTGMAYGGLLLSSFVLATEVIGPSKRAVMGMSAFYFFSLGVLILVALAYLASSSWRLLYVVTSLPSVLYCILVLPFISESPRWYFIKGQNLQALNILKIFAKRNGQNIPSDIALQEEVDYNSHKKENIVGIFQYPETRRRMLILMVIWFSMFSAYYGISFNVVNIKVSLYITVTVNGISDIPAYVISAMCISRTGRKKMLAISLLLTGVSCMAASFMYKNDVAQVMLSGFGILGAGAAYNLIYIYAVELFPTVVRNAAMGLGCQSGQLGAVVAPLIVVLAQIHPTLPFATLSILSFLGGLLAMQLPETLNQPLLETLHHSSFQ